MKPRRHPFWIASGIALCCLATTSPTQAQIVPDATLGIEGSVVTPINGLPSDRIDGGAIRGTNLFHSFLEFNVGEGRGAYFTNPAGIENILSRVTGDNPSNILGTLGVLGNANLFLINPNGIIFGPNASLNVGGSFVASTASSLNFADGTNFSATAHPTTPLLTVSVPLGLQFGATAGSILNQSQATNSSGELVGLQVQPGKTLALVGGDVALEGGSLTAAGGRISLGSVADPSLVSLTPTDKGWTLGYEGVQNFKDIQLSQQAAVEASGEGGGDIQVQGRRVTLTDGSAIGAYTLSSEPGGTLTVTASESVELIGSSANGQFSSGLFTSVYPGTTGAGGNLTLTTRRLIVRDGAQLSAGVFGEGQGGNLTVTASDSVELIGTATDGFPSGLFTSVYPGATGAGGNLTLTTRRLIVRDGAQASAAAFGEGSGGPLAVTASDSVELTGTSADGQFPSGLFARAEGNGFAGNVNIATGQLIVRDGAEVTVSSQGAGNAGNLEVTARSIHLDNQAALIAESASGEGGNIRLQAQDLQLRHNSQISTSAGIASSAGNGGNIAINADTLAVQENSDITANAYEGNGGNINITAQGIFGTQFREQQSPESNDITASSEFGVDGVVEINTPDINPSRGLVNAADQPEEDASVAQGCTAGGGQDKSEFVVTGRGGLPPSPNEALSSDAVVVSLVTPAQRAEIPPNPPQSTNPTAPEPAPIVEAQGWVIGSKGEVVLTATAPTEPITQGLPSTEQLVQQGRTLYEAERFSESASVWQQAAAAFKATGDELRQAMTLSNLSLAYQQLGQWPQATEAITESLKLLQTGRNMGTSKERMRKAHASRTQILAQTLDIQGRLQLAQGQAEAALTTWRQAVDTYAQLGDALGITRSRINQAQALQALGLYRQAQKTLTESTHLLQNQPDSPLKATGLRSLGNVFRVVGDLKESRQVLEESRDVATRWSRLSVPPLSLSQSNQAISDSLLSLGNTARAQHDTQTALKFYQQAATASASHETRIQAQLNQLRLLLDTEQLNAAQALWPQIQPQIATLPPSRMAVYARINFAQSLMKLGASLEGRGARKEEGSRGLGLETRERAEETGSSSSPNLQPQARRPSVSPHPSLLAPRPSDIAQLLTTAVQQAKNLGDQRATSYAQGNLGELYEQTQQWSSAQDLTQQALFIAQAIEAPDIAYRWQWQLGRLLRDQGNIQLAIAAYTEAVNNIKSLRRDLVAINPEVQFDFRDEVEPVYRQLVDLLLRTEGTSAPSQKNLQQAREIIESLQLAELENFLQCSLPSANQVQIDQVVNQDNQTEAVIYPIILKDRLEVILKLPQQPLRHYTTLVPDSEVEDTLEQLRHNLELPYTFREVSSLSKRVYDWLIRPIEADLAKNGVETLVFVLDGSLRNIPMAALYDGKHYLVEKYGIALTPGLQLLDPKPLERTQLKVLTAGLTPAREVGRQYFPPLPTVERELDLIKSEVPSVTLLNQKFTSTALQKQIDNRPFSVVHLATHGQFSSNPDETFILAWDKLINVNELDNLLQSRNQSRLDPIELLVLSACETADGDKRAALGLAGIAVRAGARSTLASLWAVENASVADFMGQFYQVLANRTLTKAEALRRAQLILLQQPQYRHPFYWAPYVLLGNWL